jgi:hypothetical protein
MAVQAVKPDETPEPDPLGIDALTAGETALAEKTAGQSITTLGNENHPQVGLLGALGWVFARRGNPRLKYAEYMEQNTVAQITASLFPGDEEEDEGKEPDSSTSAS